MQRVREDLETAYEELQSTNEELETTNEELQSSIEELETTNEELQSTNEELETTNEELQSGNEELETMNEEMRIRTSELDEARRFLEGVLSSVAAASSCSTRSWGPQLEPGRRGHVGAARQRGRRQVVLRPRLRSAGSPRCSAPSPSAWSSGAGRGADRAGRGQPARPDHHLPDRLARRCRKSGENGESVVLLIEERPPDEHETSPNEEPA